MLLHMVVHDKKGNNKSNEKTKQNKSNEQSRTSNLF